MKITVDNEACGNPLDCRLCLNRCPESVFGVFPRERRTRGTRASDWSVLPVFTSMCSGCLECTRFCPPGAITVEDAADSLGLRKWSFLVPVSLAALIANGAFARRRADRLVDMYCKLARDVSMK